MDSVQNNFPRKVVMRPELRVQTKQCPETARLFIAQSAQYDEYYVIQKFNWKGFLFYFIF